MLVREILITFPLPVSSACTVPFYPSISHLLWEGWWFQKISVGMGVLYYPYNSWQFQVQNLLTFLTFLSDYSRCIYPPDPFSRPQSESSGCQGILDSSFSRLVSSRTSRPSPMIGPQWLVWGLRTSGGQHGQDWKKITKPGSPSQTGPDSNATMNNGQGWRRSWVSSLSPIGQGRDNCKGYLNCSCHYRQDKNLKQ